MAGVIFTALTPEITLSAGVKTTILSLQTPTNQAAKLMKHGVFANGTSPTNEPIKYDVVKLTTTPSAGTATSLNVARRSGPAVTSQMTVKQAYTAEPTGYSDPLDGGEFHPEGGIGENETPGQEIVFDNNATYAIVVTAPQSVKVRGKFIWEE